MPCALSSSIPLTCDVQLPIELPVDEQGNQVPLRGEL